MKNAKSSTHLNLTRKLNGKMPKIAKNTFQVHLFKVYYLHILGIRKCSTVGYKKASSIR